MNNKFSLKQLETAKAIMAGNWIKGMQGLVRGEDCIKVYIEDENIGELIPKEVRGIPIIVILTSPLHASKELISGAN